MPKEVLEEVIADVSKGMYPGAAITDMPKESATYLQNMAFKQGTYIGSRRGHIIYSRSTVQTDNVPNPILGLYEYNKSTTRTMLVKMGAKIYTYNHATGAYTDSGVTMDADAYAHFVKFFDSIIISDGVSTPIRYNGTTFTSLSSAPAFRIGEPFNGYLFGVDISGEPDTGRFTDFLAPTSWPVAYEKKVPESTFDTWKVIRKVNDDFTGVALSEEEIWVMTGTSPRNFKFYSLSKRVGTVAGESCQVVNGRIIWLDQDGFYTIGEDRAPVKFRQLNPIFNSLDMSRLSNVWATTYRGAPNSGYQYWCGLTFGSGRTKNNYIFVYDFDAGGWGLYTGLPCDILTVGLDSNRDEVLYGVGDDGYIYQLDSGVHDNGRAISSAYITRPFNFGNAKQQKVLTSITIFYRSKYEGTPLKILVTSDYTKRTHPNTGLVQTREMKGRPNPPAQYELYTVDADEHFLKDAYSGWMDIDVQLEGREFQVFLSCNDGVQDYDIYKIVARAVYGGDHKGSES